MQIIKAKLREEQAAKLQALASSTPITGLEEEEEETPYEQKGVTFAPLVEMKDPDAAANWKARQKRGGRGAGRGAGR